ncbi:endolytic transglycosylase MltG [Sphingomonas sp. AX6]|uniref:endolytic transglycosylase MltG n=1 Tax=Sphingomonas sp. AX6 TaxID=2653171 RepID=UPI00135C0109|nr:endolytic transglycosylase MltG [Sphingomonas sp. AX6]
MKKLGCLGIIAALSVVVALFFAVQHWSGDGPSESDVTVIVPQGSTLSSAARAMEEAGAIGSADRFLLLARFLGSDDPIAAGEYAVPAGASASRVLEMMQKGETLQRFVTVPEGWPSVMVHDALMAAGELTGEIPVPEEGSILPDSYSYTRGESRAVVVGRMQKAMADYLAAAWEKRTPNTVAKTPQETVILAAVVEKETAKPEERRMVAGVYSNRIREGMRLQADPTVIYPITQGRPLGRRILRSELDAVNGYNTYAMAGLPVGPIANPGRASIDAVLNPATTSALYFVADGTGGHIFADTLEQHNANVRKWYAIRRERGEM